ncbi:MAG: ATP-binding cassette domain-containing protein [Bacteroidetes bacterium]|nr:ATP-binding cassette domain-containing protein [Bacteroidota bacterium]
MIQLDNLTKSYASKRVLGPIDLSIESAKTTVLIGPSGCGKSTLLRLILGLITQDSGEVRIDGCVLSEKTAVSLRRKAGYVIQDGGLFPHLTAYQNITLMARHLSFPEADIKDRVNFLTRLTNFSSDLLYHFPVQLSGGQKQRVGLMRALMLDPDILLLDEPLGALDPLIRYDLQTDLKDVFERLGKTVILVTHDMGEASFFGDTIILLDCGRVIQKGTTDDFVRHPMNDFVIQFLRAQRTISDERLP